MTFKAKPWSRLLKVEGCQRESRNGHFRMSTSQGVLSLFDASPGDGAFLAGFEPPGLTPVPSSVPPGDGAFSMILNAGGRGPSDAAGPPGVGAFSWTLKASGGGDCAAPEPGGCDATPPSAGCGTALGRRRTVAGVGVDVEGLVLTVGAGRVEVPGGVATLGGCAPGLPV